MRSHSILITIILCLTGCGSAPVPNSIKTTRSSDASSQVLPEKMHYLAAVQSHLEVSFLNSDKLKQLQGTGLKSIIQYHANEYEEMYDSDFDGAFSNKEIIQAYKDFSDKLDTELSEQRRNYNSLKGRLDSGQSALRLAHGNGDMQLLDGIVGGLLGGGLGGVAGSIAGILTDVIFPGSNGASARNSKEDGNVAHEAYEALSQLKKLILQSNKAKKDIEDKIICMESNQDCRFAEAIGYWEENIRLEIGNALLLSELGY